MFKYKVFSALDNNNYTTLKKYLYEYINIYNRNDINDDDENDNTNLITYYIENNKSVKYNIVKLLLSEYKNKNINDVDELYLHMYIDEYYDDLSPDIINLFVDYRSELINKLNKNDETPLNSYMFNVYRSRFNIDFDFDIIKTFVNLGTDLSIKNKKGYTPIHTYILSKTVNKKILNYLLNFIDRDNKVFKDLLHIYLSRQNNYHSINVIKKLLRICKNFITQFGCNSMMCYLNNSPVIDIKVLKILQNDCDINHVNDVGNTVLELYLNTDNPEIEIVKYLIELGVTIRHSNTTTIHKYINNNENINKEIIKYLISLINVKDPIYHSLLDIYLNNRNTFNLNIIKILLKICINYIADDGNTLLMSYFITDPEKISLKIVKILVTNLDLDANYKNSFGETTVDIYMSYCENVTIDVLKFFIKSGIKITSKKKLLDLYLYKRDEVDINTIEFILNDIPSTLEDETTKSYPLHSYMEQAYSIDIVEYIINKLHCDVNEYNNNGLTPLHCYLIGYNNENDVIDTLIDMGADVNSLTGNGETTLYLSLFRDKEQIKSLLVAKPTRATVIKTIDNFNRNIENGFTHIIFESSFKEFISYAILYNYQIKDKLIELVNNINLENNMIVHINNCYNAIIDLNGIIISPDKTTAYDIIINKNINKILNKNILKNINPIHYYVYSDIVFETISYALFRQDLLFNAYSSVNYCGDMWKHIPDELKDNIFTYMNNEDLSNLINTHE
ncbi:putative ankyrin repeat protein FPV162 [BeAn 58058 virus]|uniref:putative ankyrin repeat protein FPV162 n=1 Tax=BeAn 58058 virus TaxID=67082 RepID=UPI00090C9F9F|nr:putative ankyrin repeat protein FPV162 [BeAn 58058 virus]APG58376.1 putative ankyrin repeat protein FPV162 [BeAn 58058 virus]